MVPGLREAPGPPCGTVTARPHSCELTGLRLSRDASELRGARQAVVNQARRRPTGRPLEASDSVSDNPRPWEDAPDSARPRGGPELPL